MPFGDRCQFENMAACIAANGDKDDPAAWCASLMRDTEEHCKSMAAAVADGVDNGFKGLRDTI